MSQSLPLLVMGPLGLETTLTTRQTAADINLGGLCGGCKAVADVQIGIYGGSSAHGSMVQETLFTYTSSQWTFTPSATLDVAEIPISVSLENIGSIRQE